MIRLTSFSEAPAETAFSVWERVKEGWEAFTIGNTTVKVVMEGPVASTQDSYELSASALARWQIRHDERFTTANWIPGGSAKQVQDPTETEEG